MYKVFLDMDSTLNDFTQGYVNYYNKVYKKQESLCDEDLWQYEISKCIPGITIEEAERSRAAIFKVPGYWKNIPIKDNAVEAVEWIYANFDTYILTAPWMDNLDCVKEKVEWVGEYFPFFDRSKIIFSAHKNIIDARSILIDDKPQNLEEFQGVRIAFDYPYNRETNVDGRISNWADIKGLLRAYL